MLGAEPIHAYHDRPNRIMQKENEENTVPRNAISIFSMPAK